MSTDITVIPPEQREQVYTSYEVGAQGMILTLCQRYTPAEFAALQAEIAERHAQGIYTLSEAVQILATRNGLDTKALMLRMTASFHEGKLTVRDPGLKGAPYSPGTKLRTIIDWVSPHDVNRMLESWEVEYRFPQAAPVETGSASGGTATVWTPERKANARAMLEKLKGQGVKAYAARTAAEFGVTPTRLRDVLNDKAKKAPAKKAAKHWPA